jgi:hypothetical protein
VILERIEKFSEKDERQEKNEINFCHISGFRKEDEEK